MKYLLVLFFFLSAFSLSAQNNSVQSSLQSLQKKGIQEMNDTLDKIKKLEEEVTKNPKNPILWNNLGYFYEKIGKLNKAVESYQAALSLDKKYLTSLYALGNIYLKQGSTGEAKVYYQKTLEVNPKHWESLYGIAMAYQIEKSYLAAVDYFEKVIKINPAQIDTYYFTAFCYEQLRLYQKAVRKYKEFVVMAFKMKKIKLYLLFLEQAKKKVDELEKKMKEEKI